MRVRKVVVFFVALSTLPAMSSPVSAAPVFYTNRADFNAAANPTELLTFASVSQPIVGCPFNPITFESCVLPLAGITFVSIAGHQENGIIELSPVLTGGGGRGLQTSLIPLSPNQYFALLSGNCFGLNIVASSYSTPIYITLTEASGAATTVSLFAPPGTFFGATSDVGFTKVSFYSGPLQGTNFLIDNVAYSPSGAPGPDIRVLDTVADSFLREGAPNTNEGANPRLRLRSAGRNRVVVGFDVEHREPDHSRFDANLPPIPLGRVARAGLVLTIAENADHWGRHSSRTVDAHPMTADFVEGNGESAGTRGDGKGVTWACAVDTDIVNRRPDCASRWDGGVFGPATASGVAHVNGLIGPVMWDVKVDVQAAATAWLIKKTEEESGGQAVYYSKEGANLVGDSRLAPHLVIELDWN
jgi:hypothetical protein